MKQSHLQPKFVEFVPEALEDGILYVAMEFQTTAHRCCCGCGSAVYLPLNPTQWRLTFDGKSVWMEPSVGSWSLPCRSHYWISGNRVDWAESWNESTIEANRSKDAALRQRWYARHDKRTETPKREAEAASQAPIVPVPAHQPGLWSRLTKWLRRD